MSKRRNPEGSFFENHRNCSPSELHGDSLFRKFNSGLRTRRDCFCLLRTPSPRGEQFLWFLKIDLLRFHRIYLLFDWSKFLFFYMCLFRTNLPNLCPNMIHVDALDFSECHSEEVTGFFSTLIVYYAFLMYSWERDPSSTPGYWTSWRPSVNVVSPLTSPSGSSKPASIWSPLSTPQDIVTSSRTWSLEHHR